MVGRKHIGKTLLTFALLGIGCNDDSLAPVPVDPDPAPTEPPVPPDPNQEFTDLFQQAGAAAAGVDVLWVVDDSGSMSQEQSNLRDNFREFINEFNSMGLDFHMAVITTDVDDQGNHRGKFEEVDGIRVLTPDTENIEAKFSTLVDVGITGSDISEEQGLQATRMALTEELLAGHNAGFLREDALLSVVYVSDENDFSMFIDYDDNPEAVRCAFDGSSGNPGDADASDCSPVQSFVDALYAVKGGRKNLVYLSAIAGPQGGCETDRLGRAAQGDRYERAVAATGGIFTSICQDSFGPALKLLGKAIGDKLNGEFSTSYEPTSSDTIHVWVNGEEIPASDTTWSYENGRVVFVDGGMPAPCSEIKVTYTVASSEPLTGTIGGTGYDPNCSSEPPEEPAAEKGDGSGGGCACSLQAGASVTPGAISLLSLVGLGLLAARRRRERG